MFMFGNLALSCMNNHQTIFGVVCVPRSGQEVCSKVKKSEIHGIGFDATCSLVVLDKEAKPVSITPQQSTNRNIILWLDHRAVDEAENINATGHNVLKYVGGKTSPEMQAPKILWLKKNLNTETWRKISIFLDLPEFLTLKATGCITRYSKLITYMSTFSLTCFKLIVCTVLYCTVLYDHNHCHNYNQDYNQYHHQH